MRCENYQKIVIFAMINLLYTLSNQILTNNNSDNKEVTELVLRDFELSNPQNYLTENEMLDYLAEAISYMIEHRMDFLLSLLYRLDISENKIAFALMPDNEEPANIALAHLVWERQKQRVATKQAYRVQNPTNWNWDIE